MKIPCEIIVWYILPIIRREIANELVNVHHMTQAEVARRFSVTDAAISQYLKKKRGDSAIIEESEAYAEFQASIRESAKRIAVEDADFELELCRLCGTVRMSGLLNEVSLKQTGDTSANCNDMGCAIAPVEK
ncbi:MAG: transcriptional regulator [Candidatus Methanomethylophilaceae archaeon]|nr:transcriptional regulator [Candidatus Methanomethylophilaceae archaeon]